ncbi:glutathione peroxidase [Pleionea mediterranea]|uniref:Glutathione peroxidase n=1 Tax=Pleionea mediterranea TaxID=523701 RepID=A0A316FNJ0_9GAMM|nr:glutathione peroxidase [Pleionea mediterranea]PWK49256.1 glutathione peroxidase [Pleionea mediterranea]
MSHPIYDQKVNRLNGESNDLSEYKGQVLLIVNTASECGFTPQYEGLESLYQQYKDKGFSVLGFPCNQFGKQEPGSSDEIASFCSTRFSVSFPLFEKVDVNGENAHPLFDHLKRQAPGILGSQSIKWNFTKFLVDTEGNVVKRFAPKDKPEAIEKTVAKLV